MYNWNGIKYPTVIGNNNYALFGRKYPQRALVVLYVTVDIKPFITKVKSRLLYINQSNNYTCHLHLQEKKGVLLLIAGHILIKIEFINIAHVVTNFYGKSCSCKFLW